MRIRKKKLHSKLVWSQKFDSFGLSHIHEAVMEMFGDGGSANCQLYYIVSHGNSGTPLLGVVLWVSMMFENVLDGIRTS